MHRHLHLHRHLHRHRHRHRHRHQMLWYPVAAVSSRRTSSYEQGGRDKFVAPCSDALRRRLPPVGRTDGGAAAARRALKLLWPPLTFEYTLHPRLWPLLPSAAPWNPCAKSPRQFQSAPCSKAAGGVVRRQQARAQTCGGTETVTGRIAEKHQRVCRERRAEKGSGDRQRRNVGTAE